MIAIRPVTITDGIFSASTIPETDYAVYAAGTTYAIGNRVIVLSTHQIYESLQNTNIGHDPLVSPTYWLLVSSTNRWKMFDSSSGSQTSASGTFSVTLVPGVGVTSAAFLNTTASNIQVVMTVPGVGIVYDQTIYTSIGGLSGSWDSYFNDYVTTKTDLYLGDMPSYANCVLTITFNNGGGTAACGVCVLGRSIDLGGTQYGANFGIIDYSTKTADTFGGYTIIKRGYSKRASFDLWIDNTIVDSVATLLTEFRATPIVWIGTSAIQGTYIYGFLRDWDITISYPDVSLGKLTLEGLT